jgi:quercetin dioxygenase-like cupin family protein
MRTFHSTLLPVVAAATAALCTALHAAPPGEPALALSFEDEAITWGPCPEFMPAGCGLAALHGDPAAPNADVLFRVPAGAAIPAHRHTSAERMVLLSGRMEVVYEGQDPVTLHVGDYAYGPAQRVHSGTCADGAACVLFIAFEQAVDAMPAEMPAQ